MPSVLKEPATVGGAILIGRFHFAYFFVFCFALALLRHLQASLSTQVSNEGTGSLSEKQFEPKLFLPLVNPVLTVSAGVSRCCRKVART